jgi:hypothetical protein
MVSMLNPSVGLILSIGSPITFFRIVVFPALSSPLNHFQWLTIKGKESLQYQHAHFLFFLAQLSKNAQQPHVITVETRFSFGEFDMAVRFTSIESIL